MKKNKLPAFIVLLSLVFQPVAFAADAANVSQALVAYDENTNAIKSFISDQFRARYLAMPVLEQKEFLQQSRKFMGRLEKNLKQVSDRKFLRRTHRIARILEKSNLGEPVVTEVTDDENTDGNSDEGLVEVPKTELENYIGKLQYLTGGADATAEKTLKLSPDEVNASLKSLREVSRVEALEKVSNVRSEIENLTAKTKNLESNATLSDGDFGVGFAYVILLVALLFMTFIPAIVFVIAAVVTGGLALWILAGVSVGLGIRFRTSLQTQWVNPRFLAIA